MTFGHEVFLFVREHSCGQEVHATGCYQRSLKQRAGIIASSA